MEHYYTDGTEPTILRTPQAAEAATDIGADDDYDPYMQAFWEDVVMSVCVLIVVSVAGLAVWSVL